MKTSTCAILFAFAAAAAFASTAALLDGRVTPELTFSLPALLCLGGYVVFLCRRHRRRVSDFPPLLLVLAAAAPFAGPPPWGMAAPATAALCLVRYAVCRQQPAARRLAAELCIGGGGLVLVALFQPAGALGLAAGVWMFFLIQALYFVILETGGGEHPEAQLARLAAAKARADQILRAIEAHADPP
jgi:hypothetical protein